MFLESFFKKRPTRKFQFTPFYYQPDVEEESDRPGTRIKFKKIRRGASVAKKSVRTMVLLVIFLLFCLFYLWNLVEKELTTFEIEDIKIDQAPNF